MSKGMEGGVSRRSFPEGARGVAAAAVAGSAALAGCASGTGASQDWMPKSWDYECDLAGGRLRRRGHVGLAHRRRRMRPAGARAGEGAGARRRQQLHQQRRVRHHQRCGGHAPVLA